ncbi:hypothetical protein EUX98_g2694 [Antrodiella citrinella]|uniref:Uncharacterized protein n=1 Tax=Antrodiella citrinella TaxID=2447956 RepID=A0A4S4N155_9APHY|nr:hypothetical protein EUX98_g2694 [Antrodiella citrinella]
MTKLKQQCIETFELDVTISSSIQDIKAQVVKLTDGTLDILVNNAGVCYESTASDDTMDKIRSLYAVNLFGTMEMTQAFVPLLVAANKRQAPGFEYARIVQIGSIAAVCPSPFYAAYNSSKAALLQYGNTLRIELEPFGVKVITINTGKVQTRILRESSQWCLPESSMYKPINESYEAFGRKVLTAKSTCVQDYAQHAVKHILKKDAAPFLWTADQSLFTRMVVALFPWTFWDRLLRPIFGLDKLATLVKLEKAKNV